MIRICCLTLGMFAMLGHPLPAQSADEALKRSLQPPSLNANPFSRPRDLTSRRGPQPADGGGVATAGRELRAVLSGRNGGIANLGGELVETGSLYDGYQLMRIERDTAIFMRGGAEIRIEIGEDLPDD